MNELIKNKVYYKIFDKTFKQSTHKYTIKNRLSDQTSLDEITRNRQAIINELSAKNILILQQVHGNQIIDGDMLIALNDNPEADGSVTTKENLVLAIQTADCVPVLLSSLDGKVIGAVHCGWRSSKQNIVATVVATMQNKGAKDIKAVIGPCIHQHSYEVDQKYYDDFINESQEYKQFFINSSKSEHYMFDLSAFVQHKLLTAGVKDITNISEDTYSNPKKYPSYRRSCHTGEKYSQNMLSTIVIKQS